MIIAGSLLVHYGRQNTTISQAMPLLCTVTETLVLVLK